MMDSGNVLLRRGREEEEKLHLTEMQMCFNRMVKCKLCYFLFSGQEDKNRKHLFLMFKIILKTMSLFVISLLFDLLMLFFLVVTHIIIIYLFSLLFMFLYLS